MSDSVTSQSPLDLWELTLHGQHIDVCDLQQAIEEQASHPHPDFRTRLLIRDAIAALRNAMGDANVDCWLAAAFQGRTIQSIEHDHLGPAGFPSLQHRIMQNTKPEKIRQLFRELALSLDKKTRLTIGGSIALMLADKLTRRTEDIDVVDELPPEIRRQHQWLDQLPRRYGLHLAHFQSHYLPAGWENRIQYFASFGNLEVFLVDAIDIFIGKLFSKREKDRDDLRAMEPLLDKSEIIHRLQRTTTSFQADADLRKAAENNWYVLYGEGLPV